MQIRQHHNDLLIERKGEAAMIQLDPYRLKLDQGEDFDQWFAKYKTQQEWSNENKIVNFQGPVNIGDNKYQIEYDEHRYSKYWLHNKETYLVDGNNIIRLKWRPLPQRDFYGNEEKGFIGSLIYKIKMKRQINTYDLIANSLSEIPQTSGNIYTSPEFKGQMFKVKLPQGWVANKYRIEFLNAGSYAPGYQKKCLILF